MTVFVCLLRAVNVGGTGKLPMADLVAMCADAGFADVRTYIASGNVVFRSDKPADEVKAALESRLATYAGKSVGLFVRTAAEMAEIAGRNPFPHAAGNRTLAVFLDAPPGDPMRGVTGRAYEEIAAGAREIYIVYGAGMRDSKLKVPAAKAGTARNINTVNKLAAMAAELDAAPA